MYYPWRPSVIGVRSTTRMNQAKRRTAALTALALLCGLAHARGVSPYLPLNQSPEIERKIEKALVLADVTILTRPIPAATVLDALPAVCERDPLLCQEIRTYLGPFMRTAGLTHASLSVAAASGEPTALPNRRGMNSQSTYPEGGAQRWMNSFVGIQPALRPIRMPRRNLQHELGKMPLDTGRSLQADEMRQPRHRPAIGRTTRLSRPRMRR